YTWSDSQKVAAENFGKCIDLAFPNIPSDVDEAEIDRLANQYFDKIQQHKKDLPDSSTLTVHIMGEQTFCYNLINKLQKAGIPCIASCTTRDVTVLPDGSKQVRFHFTRFREY
nr:CRISPR-associated protein [Muribaculaceae bacterium]